MSTARDVVDRLASRAEVSAALADPAFTMPPVPDGGPAAGIRWLRRNVARFASGMAHQHRRQLATDLLSQVDVAGLRLLATQRTQVVFDHAGGRPVDLMAQVARVVPVEVLVVALDLPPVPPGVVAVIAKAYQPRSGVEAPADQAVAQLVEVLGGVADEVTAAKIGLLVQACDATAGLVGNAVATLRRAGAHCPADEVVAETVLHNPPVRVTRRLAAGTGAAVALDLAASRLPFGAGPHECPGRDHAVAIAVGIVESVLGCRLAEPDIEYEPSATLRMPARLVVTR